MYFLCYLILASCLLDAEVHVQFENVSLNLFQFTRYITVELPMTVTAMANGDKHSMAKTFPTRIFPVVNQINPKDSVLLDHSKSLVIYG